MFSIFRKKNKTIIDCFTTLDYAYDHTPIDHGNKFYPTWWKDTAAILEDNKTLTIKNCAGFLDFYKRAIIIPSWFEMDLTIHSKNDPDKRYYSYDASNQQTVDIHSHPQIQFEKFAQSNGHNMKLTSPWFLRTKKSIYWTWTQPTWNMRDNLNNFVVLPAVVNYKYQHSTNINFFITCQNEEKKSYIAPNTPLVALHPMSEEQIEIKRHLVDDKEFKRIQNLESLFLRRNARENSKLYSNKKNFIEKTECPFKHDKF